MHKKFDKEKLLIIGILPLMWFVYFLFELFTGRIKSLYDICLNLSLLFLFAFVGFIIYCIQRRYSDGIKNKELFIIFLILMIIDQGIKLIIKFNFFHSFVELIPNFLYFNPIINTHGSWLNARFNFNGNFTILISSNIIFIFLLIELYRYSRSRNIKSFWSDMSFLFVLSGALCSLIDKIFYGGSLDFIGISNLFIADIKDLYINLGLFFFIILIYKEDFLNDDNNTTFKDDLKSIKKFLVFIKNDIFRKEKKEKA
ncbi:signal peptidase II [uncultured Clostridium sp.]|uniref:signal peptidase II n=1 Tax=uncultured Clostridium sp. TaxID=59620 RepID=UPI002672A32A|nr:signal peptidase II [uncultured Clostridium sp.]